MYICADETIVHHILAVAVPDRQKSDTTAVGKVVAGNELSRRHGRRAMARGL